MYLKHWDWEPFLIRLRALPADNFDAVNASAWWDCADCGKQLLLKPWSCFGIGHTPLCTDCSAAQLKGLGQEGLLERMHQMRDEEKTEKTMQESIGNAQNYDSDAGINYPFELGNVHMHLPVTSPTPTPMIDGAGDSQEQPVATTSKKSATPGADSAYSRQDSAIAGSEEVQQERLPQPDDGPAIEESQDTLTNPDDGLFDDDQQHLTADILQQYAAEGDGEAQAMRDFREEFEKKHDSGSEASFKTAGEEDDDDYAI